MFGWRRDRSKCAVCGESHDLSEMSLGADAPALWDVITDAERARSELTPDVCVIRADAEESRYIRGSLEVPIRGTTKVFTWGVWCSLSEASFDELIRHWDDPRRVDLGPHFGWLCTAIATYPDTMYLKTRVHQRPPGQRPWIELEPTDHPLAIHQRDGIDSAELQRMITRLIHP